MNVRLVLEQKRKRVWTALLTKAESILGRAQGNTVRIPSPEVSRMHCRLCINEGVVTVEDMESVNGTYVNGLRVRGVQLVMPGDRLSLGPVTFVVEYEMTPEALERLRSGAPPESESVELEADYDVPEVLPVVDEPEAPEPIPLAAAEPVENGELDQDVFRFDDDERMNLPTGGDLRDFLIELDDSDEWARKKKKR